MGVPGFVFLASRVPGILGTRNAKEYENANFTFLRRNIEHSRAVNIRCGVVTCKCLLTPPSPPPPHKTSGRKSCDTVPLTDLKNKIKFKTLGAIQTCVNRLFV